MVRSLIINSLVGSPYALGAQGPDAFDCYSLTRVVQEKVFKREMPAFTMPSRAGRIAIASAIAVHPERGRWIEVPSPTDGAIVTMARNTQGYHMGTWLDDDGGVIFHTIEGVGAVIDTIIGLESVGWRRFRFHIPA